MKPRTLLKKLTDHGLTVKRIQDNTLRLFPMKLVNEKVILFVKRNKEALISALIDEHREKRNTLGHRVGRLQVCLIRGFEAEGAWKDDNHHWQMLNAIVDRILIERNYRLEEAIQHYETLFPEPAYHCKCGYKAPFCGCPGK